MHSVDRFRANWNKLESLFIWTLEKNMEGSLFRSILALSVLSLISAQRSVEGNSTTEIPTENNHFRNMIRRNMVICIAVTIFLALSGNIFLSFLILGRARSQHKSLNPVQILILHSCVADILFAFLTLSSKLCQILMFSLFYAGPIFCSMVNYGQLMPMWASPFLLVAMSADRYQAICKTMTSFRRDRRKTAHILAGVAWTLSLITPAPGIIMIDWAPQHNGSAGMCQWEYPEPWIGKAFVVWFVAGAWLIPSLASAYFYINVCRQVRQSTSSVTTSIATPELRGRERRDSNLSGLKYVERLRDSGNRRRLAHLVEQQRGKTIRLTLTIVVCNFVLRAPFCSINVIQMFYTKLIGKTKTLREVITILNCSFSVFRSRHFHIHYAGGKPQQLRQSLDISLLQPISSPLLCLLS